MSSSSPRRLLFLLLVVGLAFPHHASAAPWALGNLLAKAGSFLSALWAPVAHEIHPNGGRASGAAPVRSNGPAVGDTGCVILPDGRCGA